MPEKPESQQYRDELAEELKNTPKEEKREALGKAKEGEEYWKARNEKIAERETEEEINDGMGVLVKYKTLYHGSGTPEIKQEGFKFSEWDNNFTVGKGIYFTSEAKDAIGYAKGRGLQSGKKISVIYECAIENMKLLDLRKDENIKNFMKGYMRYLWEIIKGMKKKLDNGEVPEDKRSGYNRYKNDLSDAVLAIGNGEVNTTLDIQKATKDTGEEFSRYVESMGYDGLITWEGGELDYVKAHDSYVVFDPEKAKIVQEHNIAIE